MRTVPNMLHDAADIYEQRNKIYGDNYKRFGSVMEALFKNVVMPAKPDADHWNRIGLLVQMVGKFTRYVENFDRGGHSDSLDDLAVYTMMLQEVDGILNARNTMKERGK